MKKVTRVCILFFSFIIICRATSSSNEDLKDLDEISQRFGNRLLFRELELQELTKECNENHNQIACESIEYVKQELIEDVITQCTDPNSIESMMVMSFYSSAYLTREEIYGEDEKVLETFKEKFPEELYNFLKDYEEKHYWFHNECVIKHNVQACKNAMTEDSTNVDALSYYASQLKAKMNELKSNNEKAYDLVIEYLVKSGSAKSINTKSSLKNREKFVEFLTNVEDLENVKNLLELIKSAPAKRRTLKEIREVIAENS